jgi:hypothetical protein
MISRDRQISQYSVLANKQKQIETKMEGTGKASYEAEG